MAHDLSALLDRARRALAPPAQKAGPERYSHIDFSPPEGVRVALRRGLELHEQGHSGDGLKPETVAWARRLAGGERISPEKAKDMAAWFARHRAQGTPDRMGEPTPKLVSDLLWGGDPGEAWSGKLVEQMDAADRAEKGAPASLADRARAALARLRPVAVTKEAVTAADLGPGATPPQVVDDERRLPGALTSAPARKDEAPPLADTSHLASEGTGSLRSVMYGGIPVIIDRPKGFVQRKLDDAGQLRWSRTYQNDYGYLAGTEGGDGEGLDVYLGPEVLRPDLPVWWAVQVNEAGGFDEYKLLLGFESEADARACYVAHTPERFLASLTPMPVERLRALLGLPLLSLEPSEKANAVESIKAALRDIYTASEKALHRHAEALVHHHAGDQLAATQKGRLAALLDAVGEATGQRQRVELVASTKAATPDEQFIFGIVLKPEKTDLQGEIYAHKVVRLTGHDYLAFFRNTDLQHKVFINEAVELVESTIEKVAFWMSRDGEAYPADPVTSAPIGAPDGAALGFVPKGAWTVAHRVKDAALWADIKAGKFTGYSMNGLKKLAEQVATPAAAA